MATVNRPNAPQVYCTPPELLASVQKRFGRITFDAACTSENAVAPLGYTYPTCDALTMRWAHLIDQVVWCNPPFGKSRLFAAAAAESQAGGYTNRPTVLLLVPAAVDSNWFRLHVHGKALVLPLAPRVTFVGQPAAINRPLMLCVYGPHVTPGFEPWQWAEKQARQQKKEDK